MKRICDSERYCDNYNKITGEPASEDNYIMVWRPDAWYCQDCAEHICEVCGAVMISDDCPSAPECPSVKGKEV